MKFIKIPKINKPNFILKKKDDDEESNDVSSFLDATEKTENKKEFDVKFKGYDKSDDQSGNDGVKIKEETTISESVPEVITEQEPRKTDLEEMLYEKESKSLPEIVEAIDKLEPRKTESLREQYDKLHEQYKINPTEELARKINWLHPKVLEEQANESRKKEPMEIPDEIPDVLNKKELGVLEKVKSEDDPIIQANKNMMENLQKEKEDEKYEKDKAHQLQLMKEEAEEQTIIYIQKMRKVQPEIRKKRIEWRSQLFELEEIALQNFVRIFADEEYTQQYTEKVLQDFERKEQEVKESIPEQLQEQKIEINPLMQEEIETNLEKSTKEMVGEKLQIITVPEKHLVKKEDVEKVEEVIESMPEVDLTMPDWVSVEVQKIWHLMNQESKEKIIKDHEEELAKIRESGLLDVDEKKKSLFSNKIDFSMLKKKMKNEDDDPEIHRTLLERILKKHTTKTLKDIEAYCFTCKHTVQAHEHKGKSAGCSECGCLITVSRILEVSKVHFKTPDELITNNDTGKVCVCGHREIVHQDKKFCEEKECYCIGFKNAIKDKDI